MNRSSEYAPNVHMWKAHVTFPHMHMTTATEEYNHTEKAMICLDRKAEKKG